TQFFKQGGNAFGATAVLGTLDSFPLEIYVANARALRIEPPGDFSNPSPNIIGGNSSNIVATNVSGATIAGGGSNLTTCGLSQTASCANRVGGNGPVFATIGGGLGNTAGIDVSPFIDASTVAGGYSNTAFSAGTGGGALVTATVQTSSFAGGGWQ